MISKSWAIKLATEAARTVLSVDQIIVARQAGGPKPPGPNPVSNSLHYGRADANKHRTGMKIRCYIRGAGMYNTTILDAFKSLPLKSMKDLQACFLCLQIRVTRVTVSWHPSLT